MGSQHWLLRGAAASTTAAAVAHLELRVVLRSQQRVKAAP